MKKTTTSTKDAKLKEIRRIADRLRVARNDAQALIDWQILVSRMTSSERRDLMIALNDMIADAAAGR